MANSSGLNRKGVLSRVTVAAITAALVGTTTAAVAADAPQRSAQSAAGEAAPRFSTFTAAGAAVATPNNSLYGATNYGNLYRYDLDGRGGLKAAVSSGSGWQYSKFITQVDHNSDGASDGLWFVENNRLGYMKYTPAEGEDGVVQDIGGGWGIYNRVLSAGNNGGAAADDLIARDGSGRLYLYLGYGNGSSPAAPSSGAAGRSTTRSPARAT